MNPDRSTGFRSGFVFSFVLNEHQVAGSVLIHVDIMRILMIAMVWVFDVQPETVSKTKITLDVYR
jgi:hypothetical protein